MVEDKKFLEMGRGDAAVCGPFRPLVSLRSRRAALDVTKPVRGRERLEPLSWMTCRLYYLLQPEGVAQSGQSRGCCTHEPRGGLRDP